MLKCSKCLKTKSFTEFFKRKSSKIGFRLTCKLCLQNSSKLWPSHSLERQKIYKEKWNKKNKGKIYKHNWYLENKEELKVRNKNYVLNNPDQIKQTNKKYYSSAKGKRASRNNDTKRRATKAKALVLWSNLEQIGLFYDLCPVGYEVDHIIPLKNSIVCGLHVIENLQYLSKTENRKKSNKFYP